MSKGSTRRKQQVSDAEMSRRWKRTFRKPKGYRFRMLKPTEDMLIDDAIARYKADIASVYNRVVNEDTKP